jgi:quercetin dioxygenase-like cupin family protein
MQTMTAKFEEAIDLSSVPEGLADEPGRARWAPAFAMLGGGLLVMALAVAALAGAGHHNHATGSVSAAGAAAPAAATGETGEAAPAAPADGLTIQSAGDISVLNMTYDAGQSSGWHAHRGIHAVAILSGSLTVYDEHCVATTYGPDNPYIGGQHLHLIRNEGAEPASMVVTYINPVSSSQQPAQVGSVTPPCAIS